MIPMVKSLMIDKLYFHLLTLGPKRTWCTRRYQHAALCHIRTQGITRDRQGYHHLPPTPQSWGTRQMKIASSLDTTSTLSTITLACMEGLSVSIRALLLEYPPQGRTTNPQVYNEQSQLSQYINTKVKHELFTPSSKLLVVVQAEEYLAPTSFRLVQ